MQSFTTERGIIATLDRANVDTDQIIPKQFLKSIRRTGFGEALFFDWRRLPDGSPDPEFLVNQPRFQDARFLVARNNFGCGSSREHAVWAVMQAGFSAVIAPRRENAAGNVPAFADIFKSNASKNGLVTVELSESEVDRIFEAVAAQEGLEATISLPDQTLTLHADEDISFHFEVDPTVKRNLLEGLDDIGLTLEHESAIQTFEADHDVQLAAPENA